ncbi:hypothetical protein [Sorangium sp. So ce887]|uniref:hypothetical protein n=1 Tax=Sorangium sp. So ce887 TaxID=3133324 RepID=UPI003F609918
MASRTKGTRGGAPPPGGVIDTEEGVDDLYKKPIGDFTRARDELAKRLRQAGDKGASDRVKALRRPTAAAWALNQLARRYPQRVEGLLDAGERLREAQRGALAPGGAQGLRDAGQMHRAIVNELLRAAPALFAEGGYRERGNPMDRLRDSLLATPTASPSDLELLARGRLSGEIEPGDLSELLGLLRGRPSERPAEAEADRGRKGPKAETPARRRAREGKQPPKRQKRAGEERGREREEQRAAEERERKATLAAERRERKERLAAEQRQQKAQLAAAERERDQASRDAARAAREADRLTKEAARMSRAAEKAEEAARAAKRRSDEAERRAAEAQQKAAAGAGRLEAAEDRLDQLGR